MFRYFFISKFIQILWKFYFEVLHIANIFPNNKESVLLPTYTQNVSMATKQLHEHIILNIRFIQYTLQAFKFRGHFFVLIALFTNIFVLKHNHHLNEWQNTHSQKYFSGMVDKHLCKTISSPQVPLSTWYIYKLTWDQNALENFKAQLLFKPYFNKGFFSIQWY